MAKKIVVIVDPPCISPDREIQYIDETVRAYMHGRLAPNMRVVEDTRNRVEIIYKR